MACTTSSDLIKAASSTIPPNQPMSRPLTVAAANAQEVAGLIILPGIPISSERSRVVPVSSSIPASSHSIATLRPNLPIRTTSKSINHFDNIEELNQGTYEGERNKEGKFHGRGKLTLSNGDTYEGQFEDGALNGHGTFTNYSGRQLYVGEFRNSMFNGLGKVFLDGKLSYEGHFKGDEFDGNGTLFKPDGTVYYEGLFLNGVFNGKGTLPRDEAIFKGIFKDGTLSEEHVEIKFLTGDHAGFVYEGQIKDYMADGKGTLADPNGAIIYQGSFKKGRLCEETPVKITLLTEHLVEEVVFEGLIKDYMASAKNQNGERVEPSCSGCCTIQ